MAQIATLKPKELQPAELLSTASYGTGEMIEYQPRGDKPTRMAEVLEVRADGCGSSRSGRSGRKKYLPGPGAKPWSRNDSVRGGRMVSPPLPAGRESGRLAQFFFNQAFKNL